MKKYRVSDGLHRYVRQILVLNRAKWRMYKDKEGQIWCTTNLTSNHFHNIVQRAKCEKATKETGILFVTYEESLNQAFITYLLAQRGKTSYAIINDLDCKRTLEHY